MKILIILSLFTIKVNSLHTYFSFFSVKDQCKDVCSDSFFILPQDKEAQSICERGCRFFNIISLTDNYNVTYTTQKCESSCEEAYNTQLKSICNVGCNVMSKKRELDEASFNILVSMDGISDLKLVEPEFSVFSSEFRSGENERAYKIPETNIRTMPIQFIELAQERHRDDWLDCASRNSGVPKWALLGGVLAASFLALWLTLTSEKKVNEEVFEGDKDVDIKNGLYYVGDDNYELIKSNDDLHVHVESGGEENEKKSLDVIEA